MSFPRPHFRCRASRRAGMTRLELIFLAVILVVLVAVLYGPVVDYLTNGKVTRGVAAAHTLSTLLAQYATDNNGVYPTGDGTAAAGKSEGIALDLLQNNYTPDATVFSVGSTPKYRGSGGDYTDLKPENMSWDFTAGANATTGITSAAPDNLPVVYTTGQAVQYRNGPDPILSGRGPFDTEGMVVAYKSGTAVFIKAIATGNGPIAQGFISPDFKGTDPYTQIKPW